MKKFLDELGVSVPTWVKCFGGSLVVVTALAGLAFTALLSWGVYELVTWVVAK